MKINEIILEQEQLDELNLKGLGTGLGKVPGAVAGAAWQGAKNVWNGAKQGFQAGQNALKPDDTTGTSQQQSAMSTGNSQPSASEDEINQILQSIEPLDPASKQEIAQRIQSAPNTTVAPNMRGSAQTKPQVNPFGSMVNTLKSYAPPETSSSGGTLNQTTTGQVHKANPNNPNLQQAPAVAPTVATPNSAPTQTASAGNAPLTKAQQDAMKARMQGQRSAGKNLAGQTGGGFKQYVDGGGGQTLNGADAQGNPVFKQNVQREDIAESVFFSNFLGANI
jgi:hypothetical protein